MKILRVSNWLSLRLASAVVTMLAGGLAQNSFAGVSPGDVLVSDAGTSASTSGIIQVAPGTGNRTFITGNGVGSGAAIDTPKYVTCSPAGTIYYFETLGSTANKVISVNPSTGARVVVSGVGTGSGTAFFSITGMCWDQSTSTLLVSDAGSSASSSGIIRVSPSTGNRTFVTGNGVGSGVAIDTLNYVACSASGTIYYWETAASSTANFIIAVNPASGARTKFSGSGTGTGGNFVSITGLHWDANTSSLLVSDAGASASTSGIIRINTANGNRTFMTGNSVGSGVALDTPMYVVAATAGTIYYFETAASGTAGFLISVNGSTGARAKASGSGSGTGTTFASITSLSVVPATPNTSPTFVGSITNLSVAQNASATDIKSLLHVSDTDSSQTLTWSQSSAPSHGALSFFGATAASGSSDITPGGSITYTPTTGYVGSDSFTVQVSDSTASTNRTISVTVADTVAPQIASIVRLTPSGQNLTSTTSVVYRVTFSEAVTGVAAARFAVQAVNGSSIVGTIGTPTDTGNATAFNVPVTITSGTGEFRLSVP